MDQMMPSLDGIQTLHLSKDLPDNKNIDVPIIALTANAITGAKEMFLREGFTDYLSKPIDFKAIEQMLMFYLPPIKILPPPIIVPDSSPVINISYPDSHFLNVDLGLQYCAGMEDMYYNVLSTFCNMHHQKLANIQEAFINEDWKNYTTFVHALKSSSLSIGGQTLSEASKQLESSGKIIINSNSSELDKQQALLYIKSHHSEVIELYDKLVEEARTFLVCHSHLSSVSSVQSSYVVSSSVNEDLSIIQDAFISQDWIMYSIIVDSLASVDKNLKTACKLIISDLSSEQEKLEAINYIKENHSKLF